MDACLQELLNDDETDFVVVQATENAVPFYESRGFIRVGALARYEVKKPVEVKEGESGNKKKKKIYT